LEDGKLYKAIDSFDGFTQESGKNNGQVVCIQEGIAKIEGLTERSRYKLSGIKGTIKPGSDGVAVGISLRDNELLILKNF